MTNNKLTKWEYIQKENCETERLNELGLEGWELVTAFNIGFIPTTVYIFKRPTNY